MSKREITTETVIVTPELASKWLKENNQNNRPVTGSHVRFLQTQMEEGKWRETGEPIKFSDKDERLIDGQHRLTAIALSGIPQKLTIARNVPDESQAVLDTGKTRSAGDVLSMNGISNHTITAAAIKNYLRFKSDITSYGGDKKVYHTNDKVLSVYNENPDLYSKTVLYAQKLYKSIPLLPASVLGGFILLFLEKSTGGNMVPVQAFFDALILGKNRDFESTITILATKLQKAKVSKTRVSQREMYGLIVKTWNATIEGKYMQHLTMKPDEELPKILEHPESLKKISPELFPNEGKGKKSSSKNKDTGKSGEMIGVEDDGDGNGHDK